jgi:hypothetical protein
MITNQRFSPATQPVPYGMYGGAIVKLIIIFLALFLPRKGQLGMFRVHQFDSTRHMLQTKLPRAHRNTKILANKIRKRPMGMFTLTTTIDLSPYFLIVTLFCTCYTLACVTTMGVRTPDNNPRYHIHLWHKRDFRGSTNFHKLYHSNIEPLLFVIRLGPTSTNKYPE